VVLENIFSVGHGCDGVVQCEDDCITSMIADLIKMQIITIVYHILTAACMQRIVEI